MGRIRTIKPEFWTSLTVHQLTHDARLTFIGLWNYADDEGRAVCDPRLIKAAVWPLDDDISPDDVDTDLRQIERVGLITRYSIEGTSYLQIRGWSEHQAINRPAQSRFPSASGSSPGLITDDSLPEQGREQGTGNREQGKIISSAFAAFWAAYPRKQEKKAAKEKFERLCRSGVDPGLIVLGAERYRDDPNRVPQYTKHPTTWLNRGCWEDEPLPAHHAVSSHPLDRMARDLIEGMNANGDPRGSRSSPASARELPRLAR